MNDVKISSNRSFGIVFGILFLILSLYPLLNDDNLNLIFLIFSIIFFVLGLINSKILSPLNFAWFKLGIILGKIVSPIIMSLIFFIIVTPIGLLMKLLKKDVLDLNFNNEKTYWKKKTDSKNSMKNQF